jgi:hypothetical protein
VDGDFDVLVADVRGLKINHGLCEFEKMAGQGYTLFRAMYDLIDGLLHIGGSGFDVREERGMAGDDAQKPIKIMGHAAGDLAHKLKSGHLAVVKELGVHGCDVADEQKCEILGGL